MRIRIEEITNLSETEVVVRCAKKDDTVDRIVSAFHIFEQKIMGRKDGRSYPITPNEAFYFESIDDKVFVYTKNAVYETGFRLYELEDLLRGTSFLRINKNTIVDTAKIGSFRSTLNGRMEAQLKNGEFVEISRAYVSALKVMLGGRSQ
jgi:DNA-binding LytR/AlgR family response regulator